MVLCIGQRCWRVSGYTASSAAQKPMAPSPMANSGTFIPRDLSVSNTSRQLCVGSRTPSSIAKKCFSPRAFTPITNQGAQLRLLRPQAAVGTVGPHIDPAGLCPDALRTNSGTLAPRPASDARPYWLANLPHPDPPTPSTLHPSHSWTL